MNLGPTELLLVLAILASWVIPIWAIVDAAMRPDTDFDAIGVSKVTQLLVLAVSALLCGPVGTVIAIVYLATTRRKLSALART